MTPGSFKILSMSLGFSNGLGHPWIVKSARDALGFKRGVLVKNRAIRTLLYWLAGSTALSAGQMNRSEFRMSHRKASKSQLFKQHSLKF